MKIKIADEVLSSIFDFPHKCKIEPLNAGLINHTFKVTCDRSVILLQQINRNVFHSPRDIQHNYIALWKHIESGVKDFTMPRPLYFKKSKPLYTDADGESWRAFEYIRDAHTPTIAERESQVKNTAKTFGRFTAAFEDFNPARLKIVIPGFHDLSFRYKQFESALKTEHYERTGKALPLIDELRKREQYKHFYEVIIESGHFPQRVMHHDSKITNVLFDTHGKVICPVDFDTTMPGYFFSDLGDMIRTMSCTVDETSTDFEKINIRKKFYTAIIDGYLKAMGKFLTNAEKKHIHYAGLLMTYMQALRFLTDYLDGDEYYRVTYPEQNFDRAKNQLSLLIKLEIFLKKNYPKI